MKEFAAATFDPNDETFVVYVATLASFSSNIDSSRWAQIVSLKANEAPTVVLFEYADFADIFLLDLATKLLEYTGINNHSINLVDSK